MFPLSSLLLIALCCLRAPKVDTFMVVINGSPDVHSTVTVLNFRNFSLCVIYCSTSWACLAAYNNGSDSTCFLFYDQQLKSIKRGGNSDQMAYKVLDTKYTECPTDDTRGGKGYITRYNSSRGLTIYISYVVAYDGIEEVWNFDYGQPVSCPETSFVMFNRPGGLWCMTFRTNSPSRNRSSVADSCAGYNGTLTGIETQEEYQYLENSARASYLFNFTIQNPPQSGIWIDGIRKPECVGNPSCQGLSAFRFSDPTLSSNPTGYKWNPNQPNMSSGDCLIYQVNADGTSGINTAPCDRINSTDGKTAFRGHNSAKSLLYFLEQCNPSDDTSCTSGTLQKTLLFAYSNDFDSQVVEYSWSQFTNEANFSSFANVRFDTKQLGDIQFHSSFSYVQRSIEQHLPDPSQGFESSNVGSNIFTVLKKFFSNIQAPVCGSMICVLLKRYPNEADISEIVSIIRSHHAILHVVTSSTPSGGTQAKAVYNVASKTNGVGPFETDDSVSRVIDHMPMFRPPYPVYAINVQASGSNSISLPLFPAAETDQYWIAIAFQDHLPIDSFQKATLSWISLDSADSDNFLVTKALVAEGREGGGSYFGRWCGFTENTYNMTFSYGYNDTNVESLQVRIYSQTPPVNWLPYSD